MPTRTGIVRPVGIRRVIAGYYMPQRIVAGAWKGMHPINKVEVSVASRFAGFSLDCVGAHCRVCPNAVPGATGYKV